MAAVALDDARLDQIAGRLVQVPGVVGVVLGGSRGRGEGTATSDTDLGLYYRGAIDIDRLAAVARDLGGPDAQVTQHGGWGTWVDGGGWLRIDDHPVDLIYRDLDRVEDCWRRVSAGECRFHVQPGHPLGVLDLAYPGELAQCRLLADPSGELTSKRAECRSYPSALAETMVAGLWEARFLLDGVSKVVDRGDPAYVALLLSRAVMLAAHAICARAGRWVTNEKGLIAIAGRLPTAPPCFAEAVAAALGRVTTDPAGAVGQARAVVAAVESAVSAQSAQSAAVRERPPPATGGA